MITGGVLQIPTKARALGRHYRFVVAVALAVAIVSATTVGVSAQWPTGCVELNDIVEQHLGNVGNVGIYQRIHGDQAEAACRTDHRADVQRTFAWAFEGSAATPAATAAAASSTAQYAGGWPTTCVYLNDVVEAHLGNDRNVGIYTRAFGDQAEARCQQDHAEDVRQTFAWVGLCEAATVARAARPGYLRAFDAAGPTVGDLAASNRQLERLLIVMPWLGCFTYPWLVDGISGPDQLALNRLLLTDAINRDLAMFVASADWFADGTNSIDIYADEMYSLQYIQLLAQKSESLGELLRSFTWLQDDLTFDETLTLRSLNDIAEQDLPFTVAMASAAWVQDGLVPYEEDAVGALTELFVINPDLARQLLANTTRAPVWSSDVRVMTALQELIIHTDSLGHRTDRHHRLVNTAWFNDGLDAQERALVNALSVVGVNDHAVDTELQIDHNSQFSRLLERHHARSLTFSLPLTGSFRVWVFDDKPIPEGLNILSSVAQGLRGAERIVNTPLPFNDLVILMTRGHIGDFGRNKPTSLTGLSGLWPTTVLVNQDGIIGIHEIRTNLIYQIIASLYFDERAGPNYPYYEFPDPRANLLNPKWLARSTHEFISAFTNDSQGSRSLADYNHDWATEARLKCAAEGQANIHGLSLQEGTVLYSRAEPLRHCADLHGRMLLYRLFTTLGEQRMSLAMRDLHFLATRDGERKNAEGILTPSDKDIYRTFLRHTPPHLRDEVRHWYNLIHGGPFVHELV